jgi:hypothetical protein
MEAQLVFHHRRGFTWGGRAIFKNRGNLTCHDQLRFRGRLWIFDHPSLRLNLSAQPGNLIDDGA